MNIIIDPRSDYSYSSFYIKGLADMYGKNCISYNLTPFENLEDLENDMRFMIDNGLWQKKYYLHLNDAYKLKVADYEWCDIYGCVNANFAHYPPKEYPKLISLVPSFGIRNETTICHVLYESCVSFFNVYHYVLQRIEWNKRSQQEERHPLLNIRHFFTRRCKMWKNRLPLSAYNNTIPSEDNYIFFLSTLWYSDKWNKNDEGVNMRRAHFIRACRYISNCIFEGGLLGDNTSSNELFTDVVTMRRVAFPDWIEKTKRSALVFNTPAFWDCHGWKLGEYLALGKCIVSTKLSNDLPSPLEHGKNIHFVEDNEESMRGAIEYILAHPEYRHKLESGAKEYWEKYGTPEASLRLLGII